METVDRLAASPLCGLPDLKDPKFEKDFIQDALNCLIDQVNGFCQTSIRLFIPEMLKTNIVQDDVYIDQFINLYKFNLATSNVYLMSSTNKVTPMQGSHRFSMFLKPCHIIRAVMFLYFIANTEDLEEFVVFLHHCIAFSITEGLQQTEEDKKRFVRTLTWTWDELWTLLPANGFDVRQWDCWTRFFKHVHGDASDSCLSIGLKRNLEQYYVSQGKIPKECCALLSSSSQLPCKGDHPVCRIAGCIGGPIMEDMFHNKAPVIPIRSYLTLDASVQRNMTFVSMERSCLDGLKLLTSHDLDEVCVWSDTHAAPVGQFDILSFLLTFISQFRGEGIEALQLYCRKTFRVGVWGSNVVTFDWNEPLIDLVSLLCMREWSSMPIVDENNLFRGLCTLQDIASLFSSISAKGDPVNSSYQLPLRTFWNYDSFSDNFLVVHDWEKENGNSEENSDVKSYTHLKTDRNFPGSLLKGGGFDSDTDVANIYTVFEEDDPLNLPIKRFIPFFEDFQFVSECKDLKPRKVICSKSSAKPININGEFKVDPSTPEIGTSTNYVTVKDLKTSQGAQAPSLDRVRQDLYIENTIIANDVSLKEAILMIANSEKNRIVLLNDNLEVQGLITKHDVLNILLGNGIYYKNKRASDSIIVTSQSLVNHDIPPHPSNKKPLQMTNFFEDLHFSEKPSPSCACSKTRSGTPLRLAEHGKMDELKFSALDEWTIGSRYPLPCKALHNSVCFGYRKQEYVHGILNMKVPRPICGQHIFEELRFKLLAAPKATCVQVDYNDKDDCYN